MRSALRPAPPSGRTGHGGRLPGPGAKQTPPPLGPGAGGGGPGRAGRGRAIPGKAARSLTDQVARSRDAAATAPATHRASGYNFLRIMAASLNSISFPVTILSRPVSLSNPEVFPRARHTAND